MRKRINSRQKGKRGELELAKVLTDAGFNARRGQQFKGGTDSPDIVCDGLGRFHFECKRVEQGNLYQWLKQAIGDAKDRIPIVAHRRKNEEWVVILRLSDFLSMELPESAHRGN